MSKIHVWRDPDGGHEVWLNTDIADFDGLCVASANERKPAIAEAIKALLMAIEDLRLEMGQ